MHAKRIVAVLYAWKSSCIKIAKGILRRYTDKTERATACEIAYMKLHVKIAKQFTLSRVSTTFQTRKLEEFPRIKSRGYIISKFDRSGFDLFD